LTAPVINTVVKNSPDFAVDWVEGTDWGWADPAVYTTATSFIDCTGATSDGSTNGQYNLPAAATYMVNRGSLDSGDTGITAYVQTLHDGSVVAGGSYSHTGMTLTYHTKSVYGSEYEYSLQDDDFGATVTLGTAVTLAKMQGKAGGSGMWSSINNSVSWFLKASADTIMAQKVSCCDKSTAGKSLGRMYVDSFTFICHSDGSLNSLGLTRSNNTSSYSPSHEVKNIIGSLDYTTGTTSMNNGDYAIFIEGVFLVMT
jgi:hypothetical protein